MTKKRNRKSVPPELRFWSKVDKDGANGCWLWTAGTTRGYGMFSAIPDAEGKKHTRVAHRWLWEQVNGPVPAGLELDHLCRVRHCVNPDHLEPVTKRENILRGTGFSARHAAKTHCPRGHAYDEANTGMARGQRYCRQCCADRTYHRNHPDIPYGERGPHRRRWLKRPA